MKELHELIQHKRIKYIDEYGKRPEYLIVNMDTFFELKKMEYFYPSYQLKEISADKYMDMIIATVVTPFNQTLVDVG